MEAFRVLSLRRSPAPRLASSAMEGGVLVRSDRWLWLVQVLQRILLSIVVFVIVLVNRLCLEASYRVELFDFRRAEARQGPENSTLDLRDLRILHRVHQCVLSARGVRLQL